MCGENYKFTAAGLGEVTQTKPTCYPFNESNTEDEDR